MNPSLKIFLTIFCYISGVMGVVTAVLHAGDQPAQTTAPSSPAPWARSSCSPAWHSAAAPATDGPAPPHREGPDRPGPAERNRMFPLDSVGHFFLGAAVVLALSRARAASPSGWASRA